MNSIQRQRDLDHKKKVVLEESNTPFDAAVPELAGGDLGKIQDILYGHQMRLNAEQIGALSTHFENRLTQLAEICEKEFSELSRKFDDRIFELTRKLEEQGSGNSLEIEAVNKKISVAETALSNKLAHASRQAELIQTQLQARIADSDSQLSSSLEETRVDIMACIESAIHELNSKKIDRGALSTLLGEVANQLSIQEAEAPSSGSNVNSDADQKTARRRAKE